MSATKLHIVAFDVPDPPDYGGAIDVYYKIKSLTEAGVEIYLHCFQYGRKESELLKQMCKEVWYYPRKTGVLGISPLYPYIVYSRRSKLLLERLTAIEAPILFEGVHTTHLIKHPALSNRYKVLRVHNIEQQYYAELAKKERSFFRREYFHMESSMLRSHEHSLGAIQAFVSMTEEDKGFFANLYPTSKHLCIRGFHPFSNVTSLEGKGDYCLYHGNLGHPENEEAASYLLTEVFAAIDVPLIIAGRNPSPSIVDACKRLPHCRLMPNPSMDELNDLIQNAHINVLLTFQATGLKLKLLYALFAGRHVLVNNAMLHSTRLDKCCNIADSAQMFKEGIASLMLQPFTSPDIKERNDLLALEYNNTRNAQELIKALGH